MNVNYLSDTVAPLEYNLTQEDIKPFPSDPSEYPKFRDVRTGLTNCVGVPN